jgi:hypothetical protein
MRSSSRFLCIFGIVSVLILGTLPFSQPISGEGVVPVSKEGAVDSEFAYVVRLFVVAEEKRFENDKKMHELLQSMLKAQQEQTEAAKRCEGYLQAVAHNNQKIYEALVESGSVPSAGEVKEPIPVPAKSQGSPTGVSIEIDPADITERYKTVEIDKYRIAIGDAFGNEFLWQYNPIKDKVDLFYILHKDKGASGLVVCDLDKAGDYVQIPDGIGIMTPKFPVPRIYRSP